jgi:hypothetical protein
MSLVTTSNLAKMNENRFQKIETTPIDHQAIRPTFENSMNRQLPIGDNFPNPSPGNSFIQLGHPTVFNHITIRNDYGFGVQKRGVGTDFRDNFFKNPTLANPFKRNHEKTIFDHITIRNDYGFGTPPDSNNLDMQKPLPVLEYTLPDGTIHSYFQFATQANGTIEKYRYSKMQPYVEDTQTGNPNYKGPPSLMNGTNDDLTTHNWQFHIQAETFEWVPDAEWSNPSTKQDFLNDYYESVNVSQIRAFSRQREAGHFSEPHIFRPINYYLKGKGDSKAKHSLPLGLTQIGNDLWRYGKHMLSPRGLLWIGKSFLMQSMNARIETGIFNPIGVIVSRTGIMRFNRILDFDIKSVSPGPDKKKLKQAGRDGIEFIKSLNPFEEIKTYSSKMNEIEFQFGDPSPLQSIGYGVAGLPPVTLFNKLGELVASLNPFKKKDSDVKDEGTNATNTKFQVGVPQAIPSVNTVSTPSSTKFVASSYARIKALRAGIDGGGGRRNRHPNSTTSLSIKGKGKLNNKDIKIHYGLDKGDKINRMDIIKGDQNETSIYSDAKGHDFIPFYINIMNTDETIVLRATITDLTEDITPNWESVEYVGRPDMQYVYKNTERKIAFNFKIVPNNRDEFRIMWKKVNKLLALNYPSLAGAPHGGGTSGISGTRMVAPFVQLTIGDYIKREPGYFESIKPKPIDNTGWIIEDGHRLPMYIEVEASFVMVGKKVPELLSEEGITDSAGGKGTHFGFDFWTAAVDDTVDEDGFSPAEEEDDGIDFDPDEESDEESV